MQECAAGKFHDAPSTICAASRTCNPTASPTGTDYTRLVRRWKGSMPPLGTNRTSSDVGLESVMRCKADIGSCRHEVRFDPERNSALAPERSLMLCRLAS